MRESSKKLLNKAVDFLKVLHFKPEDIMVTGSIALDMQGLLPDSHSVHDVDLIIKMDDQSWRCLKLLETINMVDEEKETMYPGRKGIIFFKFKGITINIWKNDCSETSTLKDVETGVYVATAAHIINAKKNYNREKDVRDIYTIVKQILK